MVRERTAELERKNDALARDIIEKGQLASSLQEREAQLAEAQAITHIGSWTWDVASNRVTWSDELYRIYGLSPDAFGASFEAYLSHVHADDKPLVMAAVQAALERQEPWEIKERIRRPDGSVRVLRSIGKVVTDAAGRTVGLHGVCLDDTERTRLEQIQAVHLDVTKALVQARAWREAVETVLRMLCERLGWRLGQMWRVDAEANVLRHQLAASAEQLPAWSGFVEESKAFAFAPGEGLPGAVWSQQRALWSEDVQRDPNFPRRAAAERAGLHAGFALPLIAGGQVLGVLELFHQEVRKPDHELLQMLGAAGSQLGEYLVRSESEAHLRTLEEAVRHTQQFLAMLAHELRNPLAPMRNAVAIMQALPAGDEIARCRDIIGRQIDHLARLVDDLLDASRITRGRIEVRREAVDLVGVVHRALEASRPLIDSKCHRVLASVPEEPVMLYGDGVRLTQMLQNLLNNAAKYTPQGGAIDISVRAQSAVAVIEVRDTGVGLSDALRPKVFDLFVQGEQGLDRAEGGLGIGLALVREIAHLHGGSVQAASAGPGRGTTFTLQLPLLQGPAADAEAVARPMPVHEMQAAARRRILVVDDNRDAADSLCALVKFWGHECWCAYDGASALPLADLHAPDVVLLDIGLPGMDGYEVAARLREHAALHGTILIALTGYGQPEDRERTRRAGFSHHLLKPVDTDALREMLGKH
jgi:PAS domain S-box-containing protein